MNEVPLTAPIPEDALIRLDEVLKRIPVSKSSFYAGQKTGRFFPAIRIGPRSTAYRYADVKAWLADPQGWQRANQKIST